MYNKHDAAISAVKAFRGSAAWIALARCFSGEGWENDWVMASEAMDEAAMIFVYGTLKRGECRERMWPKGPLKVEEAFVRGCLYNLGPYPAMIAGEDWIAGEVWSIAEKDLAETIDALDEIEGFDPASDNNLYTRVRINWYAAPDDSAKRGTASTYHYARTARLRASQRMTATDDGCVRWTASR
ncbi:gamma-glutamylcyclotransferase family protein [Rosistilla carotiformis]|uniref:gamma-glutamylcyclotransferase family protein n=1 Tax=Rosistilla carotiformis TaxID=2528017 RepID=UPI0018D256F9|nr:gamma-glutamylcyclotransferase family protein [Rosistilla carotiformis]